jgi:3'-5' exoribonuclease
MSEHKFPVPPATPDPVPSQLPTVFRVLSITRVPAPNSRNQVNEAVLFHEKASLRATWMTAHIDCRLRAGSLVSIRWMGKPTSCNGAILINRLVLLERAEPSLNLFDTIPSAWVKDRKLVERGRSLWGAMSRPFQHLYNAMLWDAGRCHRFMTGPSSINGHHNEWNGNLRHTVETAEQALGLSGENAQVYRPILLAAALLHDIGKADEYRYDRSRRAFTLSDRGALVGHRHTVLEWIAAARESNRILLPEAHYLSLLHALTSAKGAEWLGIREPASLEASILSMADRHSGHMDLVSRMAPRKAGFGRYHKHLKNRPYVVLDSGFSSGSVD